ncbi:hypothetical protein DYB28_006833 [Aphanomyces astaci]|uniref:RING-type domain-containing protein n=1 Tax=Aphanomyces astaci TaxID=112090 RepID=A0A9X8DKQ2_APHAT|nr:hypothetical protein DYB28_006833 [Aphanomyces astaci]
MSEDEEGRSGDNNLSLRNDQLEYLIHYVEQDRDAILMENEELKDKLEAYRLREHEQEEALHSLSGLRKRIQEQKIVEQRQALDRQVEVQQELKLCVICMSAEKTILCLPCRHVCMCQPCSEHSEVTRCPICRLDIAEKMAIFA